MSEPHFTHQPIWALTVKKNLVDQLRINAWPVLWETHAESTSFNTLAINIHDNVCMLNIRYGMFQVRTVHCIIMHCIIQTWINFGVNYLDRMLNAKQLNIQCSFQQPKKKLHLYVLYKNQNEFDETETLL